MQEQMIQVEKLSALGRMIAGVSHELNNPLTAVMGYSQLMLMSDSLDAECRPDVERIYSQADRAAKIVRSLQMFARSEAGARQLVDVNDVIESVLELQAAQLRMEHVELVRRMAPQPLGVFGDYYQLQQVFFHLVSNARDAVAGKRGGGCLTVSSAQRGDFVEVRVQDNGAGMTTDVRQRIFDPFYTTKGVGHGTGLGLSVVYGIVTSHSGHVYVDGAPGTGATFVVCLPVAE
jgi:signal transduction histidine kinase